MIFLLIFSGYWIVYWQEFIMLPIYVHDYVNSSTDTELMLVTGPLTVIALQLVVSFLTKKVPAFRAITLGTLISGAGVDYFDRCIPRRHGLSPRFSRCRWEKSRNRRATTNIFRGWRPPGQQGTYMGFAFLPIGIGSLIAGPLGGFLLHHFGEVQHQPQRIWWVMTGSGSADGAAALCVRPHRETGCGSQSAEQIRIAK